MMLRSLSVLAVSLLAGSGTVAATEHPIGGVISLLQRLEVQAKEEGAAEANLFAKFKYWCKNSEKTLRKAVKKEKDTISELTDKIGGLTKDITSLGEAITALGTQITEQNNAASAAEKVRDDEHDLYTAEQGNFDGTISAVDDAIGAMSNSSTGLLAKTVKIATRLTEDRMTPKQLVDVQSLLQLSGSHHKQPSKPEAQQYAFKSGNVIETFKGMNGEFEAEKVDSTEAETNKLNAYNLAKQARDFAIKAAEDSKDEKEGIKGDKESTKSDAESSKTQEENALNGDSTTLDNTVQTCQTKSNEWEERSAIRSGEITAIQMAVKILTKVTGVRSDVAASRTSLLKAASIIDEDTASFHQAISFLQVDDPKKQAVNLLIKTAEKVHSKALAKLAQEIGTFEGPFDKIKQMIQKMIFRLMAEQKDEDDQKNWCDLETEKSTESKNDKHDKVTDYTDAIAEMQAKITLLVSEIANNDARTSQISDYIAEEIEIREENHKEMVATVKDAQDAQAAVTQAISVLKDFYKESGMVPKEPWEFVQTGATRDVQLPSEPSSWDSSYSGVSDPKSAQPDGVLTILDGVMQRFSQMEADAKVQDESDGKNFDQDIAGKKVELGEVKMDSQMKTTKKDSLQEKMEGAAAQLKHTKSEYDAVHQYLKDLEPACGQGDSSYDDRKQARSDEIDALRRAQTILEDAFRATAFLQRK